MTLLLPVILLALIAPSLAFGQARWEFGSGVGWQALAAVSVDPTPVVVASQSAPPAPVTARFIPLSLAAAAPQSGPGKEAGVWHVEVCNRGTASYTIPLPMVLEVAANVRWIPVEYHAALVAKRRREGKWSLLGDIAAAGGSATTVTALVKGNSIVAGIGSGIAAAAGILGKIARERAIAEEQYSLQNPCAPSLSVYPGACVECNNFASLQRGAQTVGPKPVRLP